MSVRSSVAVLGLFFVAAQALLLRPDGWLTGDQGSKYLQTRAFATQGPLSPGIDVLARDIDPEYRHQEPKLKNRGGRLVSEFLWLLPLVSAPFFRVLGLYGLYVVPALSVIVIFMTAAALGRRFGDSRGARSGWVAVLVTPVVLYGLEFWEHAPAAACVMVAAVLLFPDEASVAPRGRPVTSRRRLAGAGAMIAVGALFREEVMAALPALVIARVLSMPGPNLKALLVASCWAIAGTALVFAAAAPMNVLMYGAPLPMHMTQDAWQVAVTTPYWSVRQDLVRLLLRPGQYVIAFAVAAAVGLTAAMFQAWRRTRLERQDDTISRALLVVVHLAAIVMIGAGVGSPLWRLIHGLRVQDSYDVASAAHTWPFAVALLYAPWFVPSTARPAARYATVAGALLVIVTLILVPTDGGAQWSPRFLLAGAPLLAVVAAEGIRRTGGGAADQVRLMVGAILLASAVMQIHGIVWLRNAKADTARLTAWIENLTQPGDIVISNVYWVGELTATLAPTRRMLFSWSSADVPAMASAAARHGFRHFSVITSITLTGYEAPPALDVPGAPCRFARGLRIPIMFGLVLSRYACEGTEATGS